MKIQTRKINETARRFLSTIFAALTFLALAPVGFSQVEAQKLAADWKKVHGE